MAADSRATFCAAGCGVVTTSTSAAGQVLAEAEGDVAGAGRHVDQQELGSSQKTSVRNCSSALCSMGPRQMTAWPSGTK